jgi:anti-anti-sigma regulatory factor
MLRTRRTGNGRVLFTLSGRIETEDIKQLQQLLAVETSGQQLILDLRDVTLVNQDAVKFLRRCEADGIKLENCPLHVRRWIDQVKIDPGEEERDERLFVLGD